MAAPKKDRVKEQILDAALTLFRERHDVSLAEIARAVNISKGTLYYHYRSKSEIYLDIGERYWKTLSDDLIAWVDNQQKDTSMHRLARYTLLRGAFDESASLRLKLYWEAVSGVDDTIIRDALNRQYAHFQTTLKSRIQERMPTADGENLAWLLLTIVDGLMVQHTLQNDAFDIDAFIDWFSSKFK